jgi:hypothetical protein
MAYLFSQKKIGESIFLAALHFVLPKIAPPNGQDGRVASALLYEQYTHTTQYSVVQSPLYDQQGRYKVIVIVTHSSAVALRISAGVSPNTQCHYPPHHHLVPHAACHQYPSLLPVARLSGCSEAKPGRYQSPIPGSPRIQPDAPTAQLLSKTTLCPCSLFSPGHPPTPTIWSTERSEEESGGEQPLPYKRLASP